MPRRTSLDGDEKQRKGHNVNKAHPAVLLGYGAKIIIK